MLLLDTHAFLWWTAGDDRLPDAARQAVADGPEVYLSAASALEIAIKSSRGKLRLPGHPPEILRQQMILHGFRSLPVTQDHALAVHDLPLHHRDPFDRLIVAQARSEGLTLVTGDRALALYDVPILW